MNKKQLDKYYYDFDQEPKGFDVSILKIVMPLALVQKNLFNTTSSILEKKYGMTLTQINLLATLLFRNEAISPTELSESMIFSSGGMTKLLKTLEAKELIERIASPQDGRSMLVNITDQGKALCQEAIPYLLEEDNKIFSILDKSEKQQLEKILKKLVYSMFE